MISFIIPAHNEEYLLGKTLQQAVRSAQAVGQPFEIIVADDTSTDRTSEIAHSHGATVVPVNLRKISAVRNAGARRAKGDRLIFLDADTLLPLATLRKAVAALDHGVVGGGARVGVSDTIGWGATAAMTLWNMVSRTFCLAAGCFMFMRRDAFEAAGGFDEQYYVCEEIFMSVSLKKRGLFVVLSEPVLTSGRKARMYTASQLAAITARVLLSGPRAMRHKQGLGLWYDSRREEPQTSVAPPHGPTSRPSDKSSG